MILRSLAVAIALMVVGCGGPVAPVPDSAETITHEPTGVPFPPEQSGYVRVSSTVSESGATARYERLFGGVIASVVIEITKNPNPPEKPRLSTLDPSPTQETHLENTVVEIEASGTDEEHRFIAYYDVPVTRGEKNAFFGKRAFFRTDDNYFLNAYIFEFEDWFIEYHTEFHRDLERAAEQFIFDHSWGPRAAADPKEQ